MARTEELQCEAMARVPRPPLRALALSAGLAVLAACGDGGSPDYYGAPAMVHSHYIAATGGVEVTFGNSTDLPRVLEGGDVYLFTHPGTEIRSVDGKALPIGRMYWKRSKIGSDYCGQPGEGDYGIGLSATVPNAYQPPLTSCENYVQIKRFAYEGVYLRQGVHRLELAPIAGQMAETGATVLTSNQTFTLDAGFEGGGAYMAVMVGTPAEMAGAVVKSICPQTAKYYETADFQSQCFDGGPITGGSDPRLAGRRYNIR